MRGHVLARSLGSVRLVLDGAAYFAIAIGTGAPKTSDVRRLATMIHKRRRPATD